MHERRDERAADDARGAGGNDEVRPPAQELPDAGPSENGSVVSLFYETAPFLMGIGEVAGEELVVISANRRTAEFFGQTDATMVGRSGPELGTSRDIDALWLEKINEAARVGEAVRFEYTDPRAGDHPWLRVTVAVLPTGSDGRMRYSFVAEDISERKRVEAVLERDQKRQAFLLELSDVLRPLDEPSDITAAATRLLGERLEASRAYYAEWPPGADFGEVADDYAAPDLPSLAGRYPKDVFRSAYDHLSEGRTWVVEDVSAATELDDRERDYYLNAGVAAWVDVPLVKGEQLLAALCLVQAEPRSWTDDDIALTEGTAERCWAAIERARAEAALRKSEQRLRLARDAAELGIHDFDPVSGTIDWDERARGLWGVDPEERIDYDMFVAGIHPDDRARVQAAVDRALDPTGTGEYDVEYRVIHRTDGGTHWVAVTGQTMFHEGRAVRLVGTVQDITERMRIERELREALAVKDQFLGFISHELRTPMTVIHGMSRILERRLEEGQEREMASDIAASAEELNDLVDSLLVLARFEGRATSEPAAPCHLGRTIERVLKRQRSRDPRHEYRYVAEAAGPVVYGEEAWLERVLVNLVANAAKYSPSGRAVTVVLEDGSGEVRVRVLDEGDGLDEEELERLFEPFFRGRAHAEMVPGAGLGLAVCKRIVDAMGGRMWALTRPIGGAEFGFAIEAIPEETASEE